MGRKNQCKAIKSNGTQCGGGHMPDSPFCGPHQGHQGAVVEDAPAPQEKEEMVVVPMSVMRDLYRLAEEAGNEDLTYVIWDLARNSKL